MCTLIVRGVSLSNRVNKQPPMVENKCKPILSPRYVCTDGAQTLLHTWYISVQSRMRLACRGQEEEMSKNVPGWALSSLSNSSDYWFTIIHHTILKVKLFVNDTIPTTSDANDVPTSTQIATVDDAWWADCQREPDVAVRVASGECKRSMIDRDRSARQTGGRGSSTTTRCALWIFVKEFRDSQVKHSYT